MALRKNHIYPIVDLSPSFTKVVANFNLTDYASMAGLTLFGAGIGFFFGPRHWKGQTVRLLSGISVIGGFNLAFSLSLKRFLGLSPNQYEVKTYGSMTYEEAEAFLDRNRQFNLDLTTTPKSK